MYKFLQGIVIGAIAGAVVGVAFDPISGRDKRMMKRKVNKLIQSMR